MNKELIANKKITRRAAALAIGKAVLFCGLIGKMFQLQILRNREFTKLSENNHIRNLIIPPLRGKILDRNLLVLAENKEIFQLVFTKTEQMASEKIEYLTDKLAKILAYSAQDKEELLHELNKLPIDTETVIEQNLTSSQLVDLEIQMYDLEGVNIQRGFDRFYPYKDACGHITGYIGTVSNKDAIKSTISILPNSKVGKNGLEKTQENLLHGDPGFRRIEVNAKGEFIKEISKKNSKKGEDINLTVDMEIQKKAYELLGSDTGVVLLAKIDTGELLASVSNPAFDPNVFSKGISVQEWNDLVTNPELPLIDRTVALTYPPGSGFKINVAIAALKQNFNPEQKFFCPGYYMLGDRKFRCWNKSGHGSVNLYQAIAGSCNIYFWNVARLIGVQPFADIARIMGYDKKLLDGVLPREQKGIIPDPEWKKAKTNANWSIADTLNTAIGQGYVEVTPLQILTMVARIASGKEFIPRIIKDEQKRKDFASLNLDKELKIARKGMEMAANNQMGTAYANRIINPDFAMAGKTGTAQVISKRSEDDDLSKENVLKRIRNHGIFVSYAPIGNPKYAFVGIIEHGGTPARAVKIAQELLTEAQIKNI